MTNRRARRLLTGLVLACGCFAACWAGPGRRAESAPPAAPKPPVDDGLELPPVRPTPAAAGNSGAGDPVAQEFKAARAACDAAHKKARDELGAEFPKQREKVRNGDFSELPAEKTEEPADSSDDESKQEKPKTAKGKKEKTPAGAQRGPRGGQKNEKGAGNATPPLGPGMLNRDPKKNDNNANASRNAKPKHGAANFAASLLPVSPEEAKNPSLRQFNDEHKQFAKTGAIPTHPAMREAVAQYHKANESADDEYRVAVDKALAAYEAAGIKDPARLKPLLGQQALLKHRELAGIWATESPSVAVVRRAIWVIDVDPATGEWQVNGIDRDVNAVYAVYHGEQVELKGDGLSFTAVDVDTSTGKLGNKRTPATMKLQKGKLILHAGAGKTKTTASLERTDEVRTRDGIAQYLAKAGIDTRKGGGAAAPSGPDKVDLADANAVWRQIAALSSFPYYRGDNTGPFWGERLYIPYRSSHLTATKGPYGNMADMALGRSSGAGVNMGLTKDLLGQYDHLAEAEHPYLKRAAERAQTLCRSRCQLALADEQFGNTPASSLREFQQKVFLPAGKYVFQREADREELRDELQKQYPDYIVIVHDAPMSEASRQKLQEFLGGLDGTKGDVEQRSVVSGMLAYADMAQIDRMAAFWQKTLLPLAMRCGGPAAAKPLIEVEGVWKVRSSKDKFQKLDTFKVNNVSGQDLTHAVIELVAQNEWGENAAHYVYLPKLEIAETVRLLPHFRWNRRRLDFTNTLKVTTSIWADQGTIVGRPVELKNPAPNPDPAGWRKDYLAFDQKFTAAGEALGESMQALGLLPVNPQRQKRILTTAAAPGTNYLFRLSGPDKARRTLILSFKKLAPDGTSVEAEIFDPASKKPFKAETPVWKGKIAADREAGWVVRFDADWSFQIAPDDRPILSVPPAAGNDGESHRIPLLAVK